MTNATRLATAQAAATVTTESVREFHKRQSAKLIELLRDASLFMEPRIAEGFERCLHAQLKHLAAEADKRVTPEAKVWRRVYESIEAEERTRRATLTTLQALD